MNLSPQNSTYKVKKILIFAVALLACVQSLSAAEAIEEIERIEVIDDEGSLVRLSAPAERIISLAPSLTELIFAAGAGDKLVGVVEYSDYPAAAKELPLVGRHDLLDMERILQLNPDLVVAWQTGNPRASVNRLKELGLTVYIAEPKSLDSIPGHLERLSTLAGTKETGAEAANFFRDSLQKLNLTYSNKAPVSTFYQVWDKPLISAGGNELINDIIELCGGVNIFSEISLMSPKVSQEAVLARNPEAIIASGMDIERPEWLDNWKRWSSITAVARNNLFFIPPDLLQRHTPRALLGAKMMCEQIDQARSSLE